MVTVLFVSSIAHFCLALFFGLTAQYLNLLTHLYSGLVSAFCYYNCFQYKYSHSKFKSVCLQAESFLLYAQIVIQSSYLVAILLLVLLKLPSVNFFIINCLLIIYSLISFRYYLEYSGNLSPFSAAFKLALLIFAQVSYQFLNPFGWYYNIILALVLMPFLISDIYKFVQLRKRIHFSRLIPPNCVDCKYFHGKVYDNQLVVCALHPQGKEKCSDWEEG